jgi:hypothetical protein
MQIGLDFCRKPQMVIEYRRVTGFDALFVIKQNSFSRKRLLRVIAGVFFLAIRAESWYNGDANNPSWGFFQLKGFYG